MNVRPHGYGPGPERSEEEISALWSRYIETGCLQARDELIEHYLPLVYENAERMSRTLPDFVQIDDLISAGNLGLIDAVKRYEPERNNLFSTYCSLRIRGAILDSLRETDWVPRLVRNRVNQLTRARDELESQLGRKPNEDEIATHMNLSGEDFERFLRDTDVKSMVSLDRKWDEDDDHELGQVEMLADRNAEDPLDELARQEIKDVAIRGLSEKEKLVLVMYYFDEMNLAEIGAVLGLSESRVCQIHAQTIDFLREKFAKRAEQGIVDL